MVEICKKCGLPKDLCICDVLEKEDASSISVTTKKAKFRKYVTVITMKGMKHDKLKETMKELKRRLACGGSLKGDQIILQGDHKGKIKNILVKMGFNEDSIEVI